MAKFCDVVGFVETKERPPESGIWTRVPYEREYFGDILKNTRRWQSDNQLNDNINVNNRISIVADEFAYNHSYAMAYVKLYGVYWKITNVEIERPRIILTIGGVYNGETYKPSEGT